MINVIRSHLEFIIVIVGVMRLLSVLGDCEFPSTPMQNENGTLMYCNPDPDRFDGDSYYMRYTIECPGRSTCEYIWAGLFVCCQPAERHLARKQGKLHQHDAVSRRRHGKSKATTVENSSVATESTVTMATETTVTMEIAEEANSSDSGLFVGNVNSTVRPTEVEGSTAFASLSSEPFALVREAGRTILDGRRVPTTDAISSTEPEPFSVSSSEPFVNETSTSVGSLPVTGSRRTATNHLILNRHLNRLPSLMPSGYTGVLRWPTKKPTDNLDNAVDLRTVTVDNSTPSNNGLLESIDGLNNTVSQKSPNRSVSGEESVSDRRHSNQPVSMATAGKTPEIAITSKKDLVKSVHMTKSEFKIITIQCLLPNRSFGKEKSISQDYDYLALLNDDENDVIKISGRRRGSRRRDIDDQDLSFSDGVKNLLNQIPLCPNGVNDADDLGKNAV